MTTIVLVDDHPIVRQGLRALFEVEKDLKVIGEAGDGLEAVLYSCTLEGLVEVI